MNRFSLFARRHLHAGLAMAMISCTIPTPANAGEGLARLSTLFHPKAEATETKKDAKEEKPPSVPSTVRWWSIPAPARAAAKELAAGKKATVTRCVAIEQNDQVSYRFYAARRTGLFQRTEFVLTGVSEPKSVADQRREEQTLRRRLERLRDSTKPRPSSTIVNPNGYVLPKSN